MDHLSPFQKLSVYFVPFFMSVVFHEFAHGLVASMFGDNTAKEQVRLTLNPLPHVDVMGTLVLPVIMMLSGTNLLFGWAKPVPINPGKFSRYRAGLFWVSFAGPLMNFLLAFLSGIALCLVARFMPEDSFLLEPLLWMTKISIYLNFGIGFFNMLPLPPLDGSKMIEAFLSYNATQKFEQIQRFSMVILIVLIMSGALSFLFYPINFFSNLTLSICGRIFGIPLV